MRPRRALLYMPGDDMHKILKASTLNVDCICMDLEDGVANKRKQAARDTIANALQTIEFSHSERLVRINPVGSGLEQDDLTSILPYNPHTIVLPKVEYPEQVQWLDEQIKEFEDSQGWPVSIIHLILIIETALGIINLADIASVSERVEALIFGAEDLAGDIGAMRTTAGWEIFYARSAVVTHAAAFGLQAIDMVYLELDNPEGLQDQAINGFQMGFAGKQIIHPNQVSIVQESYTPSDDAIAHAVRLVETYREHQEKGIGAFALDGKLVDAPVIRSAERILAIAEAAGKI